MKFQNIMNWVGDRLFMPSIPTLRKYVMDNWNNQYSYCYGEGALPTQTTEPTLLPKDYVDMAKKAKQIDILDDEKCPYLHLILNQDKEKFKKCCGVEYSRQWRSGCALLDPLEESACEEDQAYYAMTGERLITQAEIDSGVKCHPLWNSIAGFCDAQGGPLPEYVSTPWKWPPQATSTGIDNKTFNINLLSDTDRFFFSVVPSVDSAGSPFLGRGVALGDNAYALYSGYVGLTTKFPEEFSTEPGENMEDWRAGKPSPIQAETMMIPHPAESWIPKFFDVSKGCEDCKASLATSISAASDLKCKPVADFIIKAAQLTNNDPNNPKFKEQACTVYNDIRSRMGVHKKEYIIDPASAGLLRSVQCIAIPSIVSHLNMWKNVFMTISQCFKITLKTGDSNPTVCREALSIYICDAIFQAIKCFTNRYSMGPGGRQGMTSSIGNLLGAMTGAGAEVANDLQGRYGANTLFHSIFGEQRLMNAICLFAFTGEWLFDLNAIMRQDFPVPINSTVLIMPAERRFVSANPLSTPSGWATYNYKIGLAIVAGSDLTFRVELICSNDYSCSPLYGYPGGRCDCVQAHGGQPDIRIFPLTVQPSLTAGESLGVGGRGAVEYFQLESPWRYDKVRVTWKWRAAATGETREDSLTVPIKEVGGKPPAVCEFDTSFMMFLCKLGFDDDSFTMIRDAIPRKGVYYMGEKMEFDVFISQKIPQEAELACSGYCNYTTFLELTLTRASDGQQILKEGCRKYTENVLLPFKVPAASGVLPAITIPWGCVVESVMFGKGLIPEYQTRERAIGIINFDHDLSQVTAKNYFLIAGGYNTTKANERKYVVCRIEDGVYKGEITLTKNMLQECQEYIDNQLTLSGGAKIKEISIAQVDDCPIYYRGKEQPYYRGKEQPTISAFDICQHPILKGVDKVAAVMWYVGTRDEGIVTETINYEAKLLAIETYTDPNTGLTDVRPNPSQQIVVAGGVPQIKKGSVTITSAPPPSAGTGGTSAPAAQVPAVKSVEYDTGSKRFVIKTESVVQKSALIILEAKADNTVTSIPSASITTTSPTGAGDEFTYQPSSDAAKVYFSTNPSATAEVSNLYTHVCEYKKENEWDCKKN